MARRGSRIARRGLGFRGYGEDKVSATTYVTVPSGATISDASIAGAGSMTLGTGLSTGSGCTLKKVDFGQGTQYKVYRGLTGVSGAGGPGTRLSNGTMILTTGLTTVSSFIYDWQYKSGVTATATKRVVYGRNSGFHFSGGTVMIFVIDNAGAAVTPGGSAGQSGVSFSWIAMGV